MKLGMVFKEHHYSTHRALAGIFKTTNKPGREERLQILGAQLSNILSATSCGELFALRSVSRQ